MNPDKILDRVEKLPPNPEVAGRLLQLLKSDGEENEEIVRIIQYEPSLTAGLLKVCNSAFFARSERVGSVEQAVLQLGYQEIARIAFALGIGKLLAGEQQGYGMKAKDLWRHAVVTAIASQRLANHCRVPLASLPFAFTAGLLHDIGKMVLNQCLSPEIQASVRLHIEKGVSMSEAEILVIGTNHAEVGGRLLQRWNFPPEIVEAVARHHDPSLESLHLSALVHLANICAHLMGSSYGWDSMAVRMESSVVESLGIEPREIERTIIHIHDETERVEGFVSMI